MRGEKEDMKNHKPILNSMGITFIAVYFTLSLYGCASMPPIDRIEWKQSSQKGEWNIELPQTIDNIFTIRKDIEAVAKSRWWKHIIDSEEKTITLSIILDTGYSSGIEMDIYTFSLKEGGKTLKVDTVTMGNEYTPHYLRPKRVGIFLIDFEKRLLSRLQKELQYGK